MRTEGIVKSRAVRRLIRKPVHAIWTSLFGTVSHVHTDELVAALERLAEPVSREGDR